MAAIKKSYPLNSPKQKGIFVSYRRLKFGLLEVILLILAVFVISIIRGTPIERGNAALIKAYTNRRMIEPRLAGGFKAANVNPSKDDETGINKAYLDEATGLIQDAVGAGDPKANLAYGRLLLSKGISGSEALKHLRLAVEKLPGSAEPYNDLGVCLME